MNKQITNKLIGLYTEQLKTERMKQDLSYYYYY
jgi:hypothetical protein